MGPPVPFTYFIFYLKKNRVTGKRACVLFWRYFNVLVKDAALLSGEIRLARITYEISTLEP